LTYCRSGSYALLAWIVLLLGPKPISNAQNVPITPLGLNTTVTLSLTAPSGKVQYDITGGTRPGGGANLFHSFGEFNVPTNNIANFVNDSGLPTSNILSRVTGTGGNNPTLSSIYGTIQTTGFGNANLFLMNPAGFLFGPNATVNVGGMIAFTTADYLKLSDNVRFNAIPDIAGDALLSAAPVAAFGFIGLNPAAINFEGGQLTVAEGTGLTLVGGNFNLAPDSFSTPSSIMAPGRPIQIASVAGPGEVAAETGIPPSVMALGIITLGEGSVLSTVADPSFNDGNGGGVSIRSGQLIATGAQVLTSPAVLSAGSGGSVNISTSGPVSFTDSLVDTHSDANGGGGAVNVEASTITLQNTQINTGAFGDFLTASIIEGAGGTVDLRAIENVTLVGSSIGTNTSLSNGDGGTVVVTAPTIAFEDSAILTGAGTELFPSSTADSGSVTLEADTSVSLTRTFITTDSIETQGSSGPVTITAPVITIAGMAGFLALPNISTSTRSFSGDPNSGHGGDITVTGTTVTFTDSAYLQSIADSTPETSSRGGNILIVGDERVLVDNGTLFLTTTNSSGSAGNIELLAPEVIISRESRLSSDTFATGSAGRIRVLGTEFVALELASVVSTTAVPLLFDAPAGVIDVKTPDLLITGGSSLQSSTLGSGPGGTITVQGNNGPAQSVLISDPGSGIFTDTLSMDLGGIVAGNGGGGDIAINAKVVTIQNGAILSANTTGLGNAGNILVQADSLNVLSGATLTSSSSVRPPFFEGEAVPTPTGHAGTITIEGLASSAQSVLVDGTSSGIFTNTEGTGEGGNIFVNANSVALRNNGSVSSSSTGTGVAGDININAGNLFTMTNSSVTTEATQSGGGAIKITTAPSGTVQLTNSSISASVLDGTGGGGSVDIDPQFVILQNSQITANAVNGPGGNIFITTNLLLPDSTSFISASSQFGQQGTITIQSPVSPASGKLNPISQKPLITAAMVNQRCAALAGGNISSFTVAGRDALPSEPGSWLSTPLAFGTVQEEIGLQANSEHETPLLSLRQVGPTGFLTQSFAVVSSGCLS
jgi:filamentous hemagglutinin family protein